MQCPHLSKRTMKRFFTASLLFASLTLVLFGITENSKTTFAQVADWCNQPGILWCTSSEEYAPNYNLPSAHSYSTTPQSWYAVPTYGLTGSVDRNESQYGTPTPGAVEAGLPAKIVAASTSLPANSSNAAKLNIIAQPPLPTPTTINKPAFYQIVPGGITPNTAYTLRFTAKTSQGETRYIQPLLQHNGYPNNGPWDELNNCGLVELVETPRNFVCNFTTSKLDAAVNLVFRVGGNPNADVWIYPLATAGDHIGKEL